NRTLTPFGFQSERRTFWEVPDLYSKMSPFWYADKIKDPILLMHGEADDNSGTFPIQSERFYMAWKGHGATVRYVTLPNEAHGYAARETLLDVLAERINWFDKYVKNAPVRSAEAGREGDAHRVIRDAVCRHYKCRAGRLRLSRISGAFPSPPDRAGRRSRWRCCLWI